MKTKSAFIFICAGSFLTIFTATVAMADTSPVMQDANPDNLGEILLFGLAFLILLGLALWLFRSSNVLDENVNENELDGKRWLTGHLNDLETNQLDALIHRGDAQEKHEENTPTKNKI